VVRTCTPLTSANWLSDAKICHRLLSPPWWHCRPQELRHHVRQAAGRVPGRRADEGQGPELHVHHLKEV